MIKIFSTDKVRELDKYTIQNEPISSIDLVERAATVFTSEFCRRYSKQTRIIVFAGQGNNGADALAIARMLTDAGYRVETYLFNPTMRLSDDCELNKQRLLHMEKIEFTEVVDDFVPPELEERDVVIDGLFGSGLNRPLTGGFAAMVKYINQSDATIVSIDIPSGLFGENNQTNDPDSIVRASLTLTFGFPMWVAIVMGTITGAFGGMIRDILINEVPLIFRKDIYALACVFGGIIYYACLQMGIGPSLTQLIAATGIFVSRIVAVKYHISVPVLKGEE